MENASQTLIVVSSLPVKNVTGSTGLTVVTASAWPAKTLRQAPLSMDHNLAVLSLDPLKNAISGSTQARARTGPEWPRNVFEEIWQITWYYFSFYKVLNHSDDWNVWDWGESSISVKFLGIVRMNNDSRRRGIDLKSEIVFGFISHHFFSYCAWRVAFGWRYRHDK